jgi:hypothetical protein
VSEPLTCVIQRIKNSNSFFLFLCAHEMQQWKFNQAVKKTDSLSSLDAASASLHPAHGNPCCNNTILIYKEGLGYWEQVLVQQQFSTVSERTWKPVLRIRIRMFLGLLDLNPDPLVSKLHRRHTVYARSRFFSKRFLKLSLAEPLLPARCHFIRALKSQDF